MLLLKIALLFFVGSTNAKTDKPIIEIDLQRMVVGQRRNGGKKVWENQQNKWKQDVSHGNS